MIRFYILVPALVLLLTSAVTAHEAANEMADAAQVWLNSLDKKQKAAASFDLVDGERENWHFIPKPFEGEGMRGGLTMKAMRPDQRHLAYAFLSTGLSHRGYMTALQIMSLEQVLWELENHAPKRDTLMYYVSIFGKPESGNWGWRFEGHHMSMNFTVAGGKVVSGTPSFFASNPGEITEGPRKGLRVLANEEDVARRLVKSLTKRQMKKALVADKAPKEILTEAKPKVESLGDAGIAWDDLKADQQANLQELIEVYVRRLRPDVADDELAAIEKEGHANILFAWAGGFEMGEQHYYRVQGPTFLLEYANTQNDAYHVHAAWRDFDGDFGRDMLKEHYQESHKE
tara:strand:+ start:3361 stop:4392 length:1032 start_codon:yes stop_codon:yes gene_type:complete